MKRWILLAVIVLAAAAVVIARHSPPAPSSQTGVASAADLGLLLLDTDEEISVLGVQDKSLAERADIRPGDVLLHINGISLSTVEALDSMLRSRSEDTLLIGLQRGKDIFSVRISSVSIIH